MFQGSEHLGKNEFIPLVESNGGILNGSTRFDFTNYFQVVPVHTLETILWAEADRMWGLKITQDNLTNQQGVVKNEVKVNVLNQPYGGFPWLDLPQVPTPTGTTPTTSTATSSTSTPRRSPTCSSSSRPTTRRTTPCSWSAATSTPTQTLALGPQVLRRHPVVEAAAAARHLRAAPGEGEARQHATIRWRTARRSALGYHAPPRDTPEYYAMGLIDQLLVQGPDSRLYQSLVQKRGLTGSVSGGIEPAARQHVRHQGPDAVDGLADPRRRQDGRRDHQGDRRGDRAAAEHAGRRRRSSSSRS